MLKKRTFFPVWIASASTSSFSATVSGNQVFFYLRRSYSFRKASCARGSAATSRLLRLRVRRTGRCQGEVGNLSLCAGM